MSEETSSYRDYSTQEVAPMENITKRPGPKMVVDTIKFEQDGDSCDSDNMQFLTIRQEDAGAGPYWVMNTDRWAFDSVDELITLLRRAEKARGGKAWRA